MHAIEIESPARLHLGFIAPGSADSGARRFGSLGLTLAGLSTRLRVCRAASAAGAYLLASEAARPALARAARALAQARRHVDCQAPLAVEILDAIPAHAGLGSGTQLALAIGFALARLTGHPATVREIAALSARGARSGIGIGAFEQGGFVVDGGRGPATQVPPVIARLPFPAAWRVILIFDARCRGLHGAAERAAFRNLPPFPSPLSDRLARLTLTQVLPGLAEHDFAQFGPAITEIQATVGDHFAPAQGGRFASPAVARWLAWFAAQGACCLGQSSWGPTGFVITPSRETASTLLNAAKAARAGDDPVRFRSMGGRNVGAHIQEFATAAHSTRPLNA